MATKTTITDHSIEIDLEEVLDELRKGYELPATKDLLSADVVIEKEAEPKSADERRARQGPRKARAYLRLKWREQKKETVYQERAEKGLMVGGVPMEDISGG